MKDRNDIAKLSPLASWSGAEISPQWLELAISRTHFYEHKDVRVIEIWLYVECFQMVRQQTVTYPEKLDFGYFQTEWDQISLPMLAVFTSIISEVAE